MSYNYDPNIAARKARNREIFQETMEICRKGFYTAPSGKTVYLPPSGRVLAAGKMYVRPPECGSVKRVSSTHIDVVNADCIDVARELVESGYDPVLLNMANAYTPGGGALKGSRAQEETLFRRSNLCVSLYQFDDYHAGLLGVPTGGGRYPMDPDTGGVYSGDIMFFRAGVGDGDALLEKPFTCGVVSVAAINHPDLDAANRLTRAAAEATMRKIRTILRIGLCHGHDSIVLGAWGCGAFGNPPAHMAELFRTVLREPEFNDKFFRVRFAIIEDHNSKNANFAAFNAVFNNSRGAVGMVQSMRELAVEMHGRHTPPRKVTGAAYISHPAEVVAMLESWGYGANRFDEALSLAVAWGHDLLEDTPVAPERIAAAAAPMGREVLEAIDLLTFRPAPGLSGKAKADAKNAYLRRVAETATPAVLVVKIADRLCNSLNFREIGEAKASGYLELGEPLFRRVDECKYADRIRQTIARVRGLVATFMGVPFPGVLEAETLAGFETAPLGSTHPRIGRIDGVPYVAKCGSWSVYSSNEHVHNEFVADCILRAAGLNVPFSREYQIRFDDRGEPQTVRLAAFESGARPLGEVWKTAGATLRGKIRKQVLAAYPVISWIAGIDTFTHDNILVDGAGNLVFVDNGASFDFRSRGQRKGWFWHRDNVKDGETGFFSLVTHPDQAFLRELLGDAKPSDLLAAAAKYDFVALAGKLPAPYQTGNLFAYSEALNNLARNFA